MNRSLFPLLLLSILVSCSTKKPRNDQQDYKVEEYVPKEHEDETVQPVTEKAESPASDMVDLSQSNNIRDVLCQDWEMDDDREGLMNRSETDGLLLPFRGFYLAPDNTCTRNVRNAIIFGKWRYNDAAKTLTIDDDDGGIDIYKIKAVAPDELRVVNSGIGSETELKFISTGKRHRNKENSPYYKTNNLWRIPATRAESDEAIRKRLKDCVYFLILYHKDVIGKDDRVVSYYGFPSCLKFYGPGIFIQKRSELRDNWKQLFYNDDQAKKAYEMMDKVIMKNYKWPETGNWVEKNAAVLEQIYANL